jgi:hypothetical protein
MMLLLAKRRAQGAQIRQIREDEEIWALTSADLCDLARNFHRRLGA